MMSDMSLCVNQSLRNNLKHHIFRLEFNQPYPKGVTLDFQKICRLCMERRATLLPLFSDGNPEPVNEFPTKIMNIVPILKVTVDDGLPSHICQRCAHLVNLSYKFKVQCETTDTALRRYVERRQNGEEIKLLESSKANRWDLVSIKPEYEDTVDFKVELQEESSLGERSVSSDDKDTRLYPEIICSEESRNNENAARISKTLCVIKKNIRETKYSQKNVSEKEDLIRQKECQTKVNNRTDNGETSANDSINFGNILFKEEGELECKLANPEQSNAQFAEKQRSGKVRTKKREDQRGFLCQDCGKNFTYEQHLLLHRRTHTGEKPYACSVCGECFSVNSNLNKHMRTHTGEKPFLCTVCGNSFGRSDTLAKHMRSHTGEKPYHCAVCGNSFGRRSVLTNHIRTHSGEKPYLCTECGQRFAQSYDLTKHMRSHTGEKPYGCTVCSISFGQKASLNKHMKIHWDVPSTCLDFPQSILYKL